MLLLKLLSKAHEDSTTNKLFRVKDSVALATYLFYTCIVKV